MIPVDAQIMRDIAPHFSGQNGEKQNEIITAVGAALETTLDAFEINTRLRIAHFLGQTCHESAGFRTTEEFASGEAYEGRLDLGNTHPGDGPRYKGRGLLQLTGRANYRRVGTVLSLPLEDRPEMAAEPVLSLKIACLYWKDHHINALCDRDDVEAVTRAVNGGLNGLDDRAKLTAAAKTALARVEGFMVAGAQGPSARPVLRRGSSGEDVLRLQKLLQGAGFDLAVDGSFGAATELAVMRYQDENGLEKDGIVGQNTWARLEGAAQQGVATAAE